MADEVRNLALRAAEAARNTAGLIDGTVRKIKDGAGLVEETNAGSSEITVKADKMGELIDRITAALSEQSLGIEQVSKAVKEMESVVQRNAANSEESTSMSEEMSAQAEKMRELVGELVTLVDGLGPHPFFRFAGMREEVV